MHHRHPYFTNIDIRDITKTAPKGYPIKKNEVYVKFLNEFSLNHLPAYYITTENDEFPEVEVEGTLVWDTEKNVVLRHTKGQSDTEFLTEKEPLKLVSDPHEEGKVTGIIVSLTFLPHYIEKRNELLFPFNIFPAPEKSLSAIIDILKEAGIEKLEDLVVAQVLRESNCSMSLSLDEMLETNA